MPIVEHPGTFLRESFMEPLGLTASDVARAIGVPRSRLSEILGGTRGISADTARRLGVYFGVSATVFSERQLRFELAQLPPVEIEPVDTSGFLVGPGGVTPVPDTTRTPVPRVVRYSEELLARVRAKAAHTPDDGPRRAVPTTYPSGQLIFESKPE